MLLRLAYQFLLLYLAIAAGSVMQTRSVVETSSGSGSDENAEENVFTTIETILHEITGSSTEDVDLLATQTTPTQTTDGSPDCWQSGKCGITTPPSPTQVLDIDLDTEAAHESDSTDDDAASGEYENEHPTISPEDSQRPNSQIDQNYLNKVFKKLDNLDINKAIEEAIRKTALQDKVAKIEKDVSSMAAILGDFANNFSAMFQTQSSQKKQLSDMLDEVRTFLSQLNSENLRSVSIDATQEPTTSWMRTTQATEVVAESDIAKSVGDILKSQLEEANERSEKNMGSFRQELLQEVQETLQKCGRCGKESTLNENRADTGGERQSEEPSPEDPPLTTDVTASSKEPTTHDSATFPKVMMCKSCCEEVPLSEYLATRKRRREYKYTDTAIDYSETRESDSYDVVSTATLSKSETWDGELADEFDIDFEDDETWATEVVEETMTDIGKWNASVETTTETTEQTTSSSFDHHTSLASTTIPLTTSGIVSTYPSEQQDMTPTGQNGADSLTTIPHTTTKPTETGTLATTTMGPLMSHLRERTGLKGWGKLKKTITSISRVLDVSHLNVSSMSVRYEATNDNSSKFDTSPEVTTHPATSTVAWTPIELASTESFFNSSNTSTLASPLTTDPSIYQQATSAPLRTPKASKNAYPAHCAELYYAGERRSGVYRISPLGRWSWKVYCDMETDGGGWTIIQRRMYGNVNFTRSWEEYKRGFGFVTGDYWIGLDRMHALTTNAKQRTRMTLRIDLRDWYDVSRFAQYDTFRVGNEAKKYKLVIKNYQGTAGNAMQYGKNFNHNHQGFTAIDRDNDGYLKGNCGQYYRSGWWFNACFAANLNGRYYNGKYTGIQNGIYWGTWYQLNDEEDNSRYSFKYVDMKIRPANYTAILRQRSST